MRHAIIAGLALFLSAVTAQATIQATIQCHFTTECIENETCQDTDFAATITKTDENSVKYYFVTDAEIGDVLIFDTTDKRASHIVAKTSGALHSLTISEDGTTRYSVHFTDTPMAITYMGDCERTE